MSIEQNSINHEQSNNIELEQLLNEISELQREIESPKVNDQQIEARFQHLDMLISNVDDTNEIQ
jgi:uncharacterized protein YlxW (UPF0749 family)